MAADGGGASGPAVSAETHRPFLDSPVEGYILFRLGLAILLLVAASAGQWDEIHTLIALPYEISGVAFLAMGVSAALVRRYKDAPWFLWSQMVVDTIFATALVSLSSGPQSTFFVLYFMSVVAAARLLPSLGVVFVAGLDVVAYTLVSVAGLLGWLGWDLSLDILVLYTQVLVRIFGLLLVGFLSVGLVSRGALLAQIQHTRTIQRAHIDMLDQLPVAVLSIDRDTISALNIAATALFGDVLGRSAREILPEALLHAAGEHHITLGDAERWLRCLRHPVGEDGAVYIFEDVTRLREMEAQVEREERLAAVGRLAASLAHEIRNPLASLSGSVQLLEERKANPLQRIILREVQRLNELVEQFLQSSRPLELTFIRLPPGPIVEEVVTAFRNDPRCRDLRAVELLLEETEAVRLDPSRFRQVLWNLLVNAVQATHEGGHIRVSVRPAGETVEVAVQDDGVGIPPDKLLRIFDPFYTTRSGGTGLGLANVDRIVRAHEGEVRVESLPGEGTTFRIWLPQIQAPPQPTDLQRTPEEQEQSLDVG